MRRKGKRTPPAVDLTSLLDVIFIVLMVVMAAQVSKTEAAEKSGAELKDTKELYQNVINADNSIYIVSVTAPYDEENVHKRQIRILPEGREEQTYDLDGTDTRGYGQLEEYLEGYAAEHDGSDDIVIFAMNSGSDRILYRDEKQIVQILLDISGAHENVFINGTPDEVE